MARQQVLKAKGMEAERNEEIEDAAAILYGHRDTRKEFQKKEHEAAKMLTFIVAEQVKAKKLKLPPEAAKGETVVVYRFKRDGETLEVPYKHEAAANVRLAKEVKLGAEDDDDKGEAEELLD